MTRGILWVVFNVHAENGAESFNAAGREKLLDPLKLAGIHQAGEHLCDGPNLEQGEGRCRASPLAHGIKTAHEQQQG